MRKILLLLFTLPVFAQTEITGVVVDKNGNPIPYVTITKENQNTITNSEVDGTFKIVSTKDSKLIFSAVGFETKTVKPSQADKVVLNKVIFELEEVLIKSQKRKTITIGKSKGTVRIFEANDWTGKTFQYSDEMKAYPFLKSIRFYSLNELDSVKVNIMVKRVNPDGSPGSDLLENNAVATLKKGDRYTSVNMEKFVIQIPENGIFVSIQGLKIKENKFCETYNMKYPDGKSKKETLCTYQPYFGFLPSNENKTWFFEKGKWVQHELYKLNNAKEINNIFMKKYHEKYLDLPISLTLTN